MQTGSQPDNPAELASSEPFDLLKSLDVIDAVQVQRADQPVRLEGVGGLQPELGPADAQPARWTNSQASTDRSAAAATAAAAEPFPGVKLFRSATVRSATVQ